MSSIPVTPDAVPVLEVRDLGVSFMTPAGEVEAVGGISLEIQPGECLGVVGESGAGKSQAFLAVMGLLASNGRVSGRATLGTKELISRSEDLDRCRGRTLPQRLDHFHELTRPAVGQIVPVH